MVGPRNWRATLKRNRAKCAALRPKNCASIKYLERDRDSKKSDPALARPRARPASRVRQMVICVPSSTTRLAGSWKKRAGE